MLGLEIGPHSIKAVELQKKDGSTTLVNLKLQEQLPQEPLSDGLKRFLKDVNFGSRQLNISVSGHLVLGRVIELPQMQAEELKNAVRFEAERFIPFNIDEAVVDYQIVFKKPETKKVDVLVAAAKKDFVKNYINMISQAGFTVNAVDVDSIAITNAFLNAYPKQEKESADKPSALLNVGDAFLNMSIIHKGIPFVLRDIDNVDTDPERLARELSLSFGYFENQFAKGIEVVYLSGKASRLPVIKEALSESLDIRVELWDPLTSIIVERQDLLKALEGVKQELAICVGLAIRDDQD